VVVEGCVSGASVVDCSVVSSVFVVSLVEQPANTTSTIKRKAIPNLLIPCTRQ